MKYLVIILLALGLLAGGWYAYGIRQRSVMLNSGRPLLLINSKAGTYSYSDLMQPDDITTSFKIVGYVSDLSASDIASLTQGLRLVVGVSVTPGDPRVMGITGSSTVVPTAAELEKWTKASATLSQAQRTLCQTIEESNLGQACLADHYVFNALKAKAGISTCDSLYIAVQKEACKTTMQSKTSSTYVDSNNNALIDGYEFYAQPSQTRTNIYNLPVINPSE